MAQAASKTCEICISAPGSQYCLECEQNFCENCKTFHSRQKISKTHQFQSSSDVIPEGKSKCKDHNEDFSFVCKTCDVVVCSSCVTGSHTRHAFSKLLDSIKQLKEKNTTYLRIRVQQSTQNMKQIEKGIKEFDVKVEGVVKAITKEGTQLKAMVDKCVAEMISSVNDQSRREKDKLTKIMADTRMDLEAGSDLDKKIHELDKIRNDGKLLKSLQKLTDDIAKLTIKPIPEFPKIKYTAKSATYNDVKQLFGNCIISEMRTQQIMNKERELPSFKRWRFQKNPKSQMHAPPLKRRKIIERHSKSLVKCKLNKYHGKSIRRQTTGHRFTRFTRFTIYEVYQRIVKRQSVTSQTKK
ncbi:transcription intermediary factor 1-beta-like [Mytilus trossulus]|uniref:transcription intermediary factor 1-beta-like n=1 Tax=Mytilus trossulus TaxID=6551 RepID=UPI0030046618